ncbi:putative transcription factor interactor and regulator AUX-IAA family [Rosa chinensis]|uniref:Auxin-responsive protein n=1 Tax=Rosa chinensis TaxID=74649 RepID=A0A2P6PXS2_ROSCH|nr:auxin-responsive protein IAA29 [Rosa chinensis]PRQ26733.1 putative transcription factor interactor and regulator AUX-IAA family [Rosa chinensis]
MELQLGLALSLPVHQNAPVKGFDVTSHGVMGLDLWSYGCCLESKKKRSHDTAFEKIGNDDESKMLPLLLWHGQPDEEDDDGKRQKKRDSCSLIDTNDDGEGNQVVGWPPIKSWRKKMFFPDHQHHGRGRHDLQNHQNIVAKENDGAENSMYVKVKMEGVGILRKIDIKLHHSYQTLRDSLIAMFAKCKGCENEDTADFTLTYQDVHGDWSVAGDVPWQTFVNSVQRLEIVKNGG